MVLAGLFLAVRGGLVGLHGLWADEVFSLAMATGHSLEHPAAEADPLRGDYIETPAPVDPAFYARYLEHEDPPAGLERVARAVFLSDTSPPCYYLLLHGWTLLLGTSDVALRLFSLAWALACLPLLWSIARHVGGRCAAVPAVVLFAFAPVSVFYSTEGRMYSLLWFLTLLLLWSTLRLARWGSKLGYLALWIIAAAAGLLTNYFFVFVWAPALVWLAWRPCRLQRGWLALATALVLLLVAPWYVRLPEILAGWRVTATWLNLRPGNYYPVLSWLYLPWTYFALHGVWGVPLWLEPLPFVLFVVLGYLAVRRAGTGLFRPRRCLLWLGVAGVCLGPIVFDFLRGTYTVTQMRYVSAGMPAAFVLAGFAFARLPRRSRVTLLALLVAVWSIGSLQMHRNLSRAWEPFREVGRFLAEHSGSDDLVIVHSIPSGVTGVARYLEAYRRPEASPALASWVGQLATRRVPQDVERLITGYRRVFLVKLHDVGEPAPQEDWLRARHTVADERDLETAVLLTFVPRAGDRFAPP